MIEKEVLLVSKEGNLRLNQKDFQSYVNNLNQREYRVVKVAEQEDKLVYKLLTYGEWIRMNSTDGKRTQQRNLSKIFYIGASITRYDFNIKIRKVRANLDKGRQVRIVIKTNRSPKKPNNMDLITEWLEVEFGNQLLKIKDMEYQIRS